MAYKYPICDVFHWFCKIAQFFATEPCFGTMSTTRFMSPFAVVFLPFPLQLSFDLISSIFSRMTAFFVSHSCIFCSFTVLYYSSELLFIPDSFYTMSFNDVLFSVLPFFLEFRQRNLE